MVKKNGKLYLYCVIETPPSWQMDKFGIDGEPIELVKQGKLSAVVSRAYSVEYLLSRQNVTHHQEVIESVRDQMSSVLPFSFGTVAMSEDAVKKRVLTEKKKELLKALESVKDRKEIILRAVWRDLERVIRDFSQTEPELISRRTVFGNGQVNVNEAIEIGKIVEKSLQRERERLKERVLQRLSPLSVLHKEGSPYYDQMVFHLMFLVDERQQKKFQRQVTKIKQLLDKEDIALVQSQFMAAYDFVRIPVDFGE